MVRSSRSSIRGGDDDEMEVVNIPSEPESVPSSGLRTMTTMSKGQGMVACTDEKDKAPLIPGGPG